VRWNLVSRNVAKLVTLPRIERHESQTLTAEQAKHLLEVARGSRIEALLLVAVTTGMRRGELLALR
jgi:integrase